jgi:hypothetical protein
LKHENGEREEKRREEKRREEKRREEKMKRGVVRDTPLHGGSRGITGFESSEAVLARSSGKRRLERR